MIELLIVAVLVVTIWHYVYEGAIVPAIRIDLRYKMFALRDRLRKAKESAGSEFNDELFSFIDGAISARIRHLPFLNLWIAYFINKEVHKNSELNAAVFRRWEEIGKCPVQEVKNIDRLMARYHLFALLTNSGGWLIFLLPFLMLAVCVISILGFYQLCKNKIREKLLRISLAPESQIRRVAVYEESREMAEVEYR